MIFFIMIQQAISNHFRNMLCKFYLAWGFLAGVIALSFADDFATAREEINKVKLSIDYTTFCAEMSEGEDKTACRMKNVLSVGFLVCQRPIFGEKNCSTIIDEEINNLQRVHREGNVKIVQISPPPIDDVRCGKESSLNCTGFLEHWVDHKDGQFKQVRDHISDNTTQGLIEAVKSFTTPAALVTTASDLSKIKSYMMENPNENQYRQICDLQGFFMVSGGFLVNDVPDILTGAGLDGVCWNDEPTTEQVIKALDDMISAFGSKNDNVDSGNRNGEIKITGLHINAKIILTISIAYCTFAPK